MFLPGVNLPDMLEEIARQMRSGDYSPCVEAVLVTRDMETDILTISPWGDRTGCVEQAATLMEKLDRRVT